MAMPGLRWNPRFGILMSFGHTTHFAGSTPTGAFEGRAWRSGTGLILLGQSGCETCACQQMAWSVFGVLSLLREGIVLEVVGYPFTVDMERIVM